MHLQQSQRALAFMRSSLAEQREHSRVQLPIHAVATFPQTSGRPHTALLRDINMLGAFFYCKEAPEVGHVVILEFCVAEEGNKTNLVCEGVAVGIEKRSRGSAIGVAVRFTHYELCRQSTRLKCTPQSDETTFINWTVEMVERLFRNKRSN